MEKLTKERATEIFNQWLDFKHVKENKRVANEDSAENLIEEIQNNNLILDADNNFIYYLLFPVGDVSELIFKSRINVQQLHSKLAGVKASDGDGRLLAYSAASTGINTGILKRLDLEDYNICVSIMSYFL